MACGKFDMQVLPEHLVVGIALIESCSGSLFFLMRSTVDRTKGWLLVIEKRMKGKQADDDLTVEVVIE
jgi:hypothetical protein